MSGLDGAKLHKVPPKMRLHCLRCFVTAIMNCQFRVRAKNWQKCWFACCTCSVVIKTSTICCFRFNWLVLLEGEKDGVRYIGSEFGVDGGGVEQNYGNWSGMSRSSLWNMLWEWMTSKKARRYATRPNHVTSLTWATRTHGRVKVLSSAEHWQDWEKCSCDEVFCLRSPVAARKSYCL